jgi:hypothetical protein
MNTTKDLKNYILETYNLEPKVAKKNYVEYDRISFQRNQGSMLEQNNDRDDMWTIKRNGHSVDYFRTDELEREIAPGGNLLYFVFPIERAMDGI